jgi:hypothetical protein
MGAAASGRVAWKRSTAFAEKVMRRMPTTPSGQRCAEIQEREAGKGSSYR